LKQNKIYIISFFEGAAVMATELCGTKLIAPYFGSSLYVWSAVIAITLGSLAAGYFYGGRLSLKENRAKIMFTILLLSSLYMGLMPLLSGFLKVFAIGMPLIPAATISAFVLLFAPMFFMGATSPLIISLQTSEAGSAGRVSGLVYSISTTGGITATFASGFYLIPAFGLQTTLLVFAVLLLASLLLLMEPKSNIKVGSMFIALLFLGFKQAPLAKNCIYETDGLLGKLDILDDSIVSNDSVKVIRKLLVNQVVQTEMDLRTKTSVSEYVKILDTNILPSHGNALVLGLGGGVTSNLFFQKGYHVTGVEFDERIIHLANTYFFLNKKVKTSCDDARHFINGCEEKFDYILIDIFKAEEQPAHVITVESLLKLKQLLLKKGMLIINWHGYSSGERGMGTSILLNTLRNGEYNYKIASASDLEDYRNLVIFASPGEVKLYRYELPITLAPTSLLNKDAHPVLEKYNALANQDWRKNYIQYYYSK
jgi:predicted membrane-bound spermidine synthase